jgi:DNA-binding MarR family transcriptional regulator
LPRHKNAAGACQEIVKETPLRKQTGFKFGKLYVCTYICDVKLEEAIQSVKFKNQTQKAGLNILYTAWWLKTVMSRELKQFGLTHEQYNVLRILKGKSPDEMCVKDIAGRMIEKSSNVPRILDRLVLKKLVKRATDSNDKRHTVMTLTAAGFNILEQSTKKVDDLFARLIEMDEASAAKLNNLLEELRAKES